MYETACRIGYMRVVVDIFVPLLLGIGAAGLETDLIARVGAEQVVLIPHCAECFEVWLQADDDRWRAYLDTNDELVFYCPECAEYEFRKA